MEGYGQQTHHRTDEYGNPVYEQQQHGAYGRTTEAGYGAQHHPGKKGLGEKLHRSNSSSSSSSSESDGEGGRRKKGIKDKIKEKLPGKKKDPVTGQTVPTTHTSTTTTGTTETGEKKGFMEKIKEKLPGHQ